MLIIKTDNPDEQVKCLKDYYLVDDIYAIITVIEEIDDDYIRDNHRHEMFKNKIVLLEPLLILTKSNDVVEYLNEHYITNVIYEISSIFNTISVFIENGILPIDHELIIFYIKNNITHITNDNSDYDYKMTIEELYTFNIFKQLGYLNEIENNVFEPTYKMLNTLYDTKYYVPLVILTNISSLQIMSSEKYVKSIYELLKLIDIHIIISVNEYLQSNCDNQCN